MSQAEDCTKFRPGFQLADPGFNGVYGTAERASI